MKKITLFLFISLFLMANPIYADDANDESEMILIPSIGFGAVGVNTSLDFMYRASNGFAMFVNLNLASPLTPMGGLIGFSEAYFGYALKKEGFYFVITAGTLFGGGASFYGYSNYLYKKELMSCPLDARYSILVMFAIRNDFTYFFNEKIGLSLSHTHALGLHQSPWLLRYVNHDSRKPDFHIYSFMIKAGVAVKI